MANARDTAGFANVREITDTTLLPLDGRFHPRVGQSDGFENVKPYTAMRPSPRTP